MRLAALRILVRHLQHAYHLAGTKAFMPPLGLLTIAAYLPRHWEVRFVDDNHSPATEADLAWADAVFSSGMHIQRRHANDICERAHAHGKIAVLGGPSVSSCPDYYPAFDILHCGELGDATDAIIAMLGESIARPAEHSSKNSARRASTPWDWLEAKPLFVARANRIVLLFPALPDRHAGSPKLPTGRNVTRSVTKPR